MSPTRATRTTCCVRFAWRWTSRARRFGAIRNISISGRYRAVADLPDYDALKDQTRQIKEKSIASLPELVQTLKSSVRGARWACFRRQHRRGRLPLHSGRVPLARREAGREREEHHLGGDSPQPRFGGGWHRSCRERSCGIYSATGGRAAVALHGARTALQPRAHHRAIQAQIQDRPPTGYRRGADEIRARTAARKISVRRRRHHRREL